MKPLQQINGHTIEFHPQTQKLAVHFKYIVPCESSAEEDLQTQKLELVQCESTAEEVSFEW